MGDVAPTEMCVRCPQSPYHSKITSDGLKISTIRVTASRKSVEMFKVISNH